MPRGKRETAEQIIPKLRQAESDGPGQPLSGAFVIVDRVFVEVSSTSFGSSYKRTKMLLTRASEICSLFVCCLGMLRKLTGLS